MRGAEWQGTTYVKGEGSTAADQAVLYLVTPAARLTCCHLSSSPLTAPTPHTVFRSLSALPSQVKASFSSKITSTNNVVLIPVPEQTAKANILVTNGKAKYDATKQALVSFWSGEGSDRGPGMGMSMGVLRGF